LICRFSVIAGFFLPKTNEFVKKHILNIKPCTQTGYRLYCFNAIAYVISYHFPL